MNKRRGSQGAVRGTRSTNEPVESSFLKSAFSRRSILFQGDASEIGDLKIENDRLQTTVMILNQKIKAQTQTDDQVSKLRKKNRDSEGEIQRLQKDVFNLKGQVNMLKCEKDALKAHIASQDSTIDSLEGKVAEHRSDLERSESSRASLKQDIEELNDKLIQLEDENFLSKTAQLEQLQSLHDQEI